MDLRELRLYHWKKALLNRDYAIVEEHRGFRKNAQKASTLANFHINAVRALDEVVSGTVERDAELEESPHG